MQSRILALVVLVAISIVTHSQGELPERNIILIVTDDESPTLGCYGDPIAKTPAIDKIAADGVVFENAFATTASCSPSRSVILSGVHSHRTGQYGLQHRTHNFESYPNLGRLTLPHVLRQVGYRTAQIGKYHVGPESAYHFENYLDGNSRNPVQMADSCREFLTNPSDSRPFFLYFATSDPHRSGGVDERARSVRKPNLFGNKPRGGIFDGVDEVTFDPADVPVPAFLPDTQETREELAQYYQSCARIDQGIAKLVQILKKADLYERTLIVFTSDHGMAFAGAKTTVYDAGLRVPLVVRDPYQRDRGERCKSLASHVDITPSLLDFAGGLDSDHNCPKALISRKEYRGDLPQVPSENRNGGREFDAYHGRSWLHCLANPALAYRQELLASHTFHEVTMYYPMRALRDQKYKLIWNIAHELPFPFAADLWTASSWQTQFAAGEQARYGSRTVAEYLHRPEFELYDIAADPSETTNLADQIEHQEKLKRYQQRLKALQKKFHDPWILKWDRE